MDSAAGPSRGFLPAGGCAGEEPPAGEMPFLQLSRRHEGAFVRAFRNILKRMLEAKGRGFWSPSDDVLARLQDLFEEVEDEIEGVA